MKKPNQTAGLLGFAFAIVLLAISPARAADLEVGNLVVDKDARISGNLGIGVNRPLANVQINQTGSGVGIFLGNRTPFGQALFETDLTAPATHAFFAEMGNRVFSVAGGGDGFCSAFTRVAACTLSTVPACAWLRAICDAAHAGRPQNSHLSDTR
jgi:hypothetical protein